MVKEKIEFNWIEELSMATCNLEVNGHVFHGSATCHPKDKDMCSEKTGEEIAYRRATISYLQYLKENYQGRIQGLKQFYYSINQSKKYNADSYEAIMLRRQIRLLEEELDIIKEMIIEEKHGLRTYISLKDDFYNTVRSIRGKDKNY